VTVLTLVTVVTVAFLAWRRSQPSPARPDTGVRVVAVLPFDNLGDSADAYFADGVADEIRTKLAQLAGLEVIARTSSLEYRHSGRRPSTVARELGADYLLTGTVRWEKAAGASRVRVTPELVDARGGDVARTRWAQQFDASLTDVFQVQADIATKVADALGVALADSARRALAARPTASLAAWEAFLQGEAASEYMKADQVSLRRAIGFYQQAVALDSGFVQAWSQLSRARTSYYSNGVPDPALGAQALEAAERGRRLGPGDPTVYLALGDYYGAVNPVDNARAVAEYERGLRLAPDNVDLLGSVVSARTSLGQWEGVAAPLARAAQLDPRSVNVAPPPDGGADLPAPVSRRRLRGRPRPRARARQSEHRLAQGDGRHRPRRPRQRAGGDPHGGDPHRSPRALSVLRQLPGPVLGAGRRQQRRVLAAPPGAFDDDRGTWGLVHAELYHLRGDRVRAAAYADSARSGSRSRSAPRRTTGSATRSWACRWPTSGERTPRCARAGAASS
jgi:Predicted integral membrane protein